MLKNAIKSMLHIVESINTQMHFHRSASDFNYFIKITNDNKQYGNKRSKRAYANSINSVRPYWINEKRAGNTAGIRRKGDVGS